MTQSVKLKNSEELVVRLESGRVVHLWAHHCDNFDSLDVWTNTADERDHEISAETGDNKRAPFGLFAMVRGHRYELEELDEPSELPETNGREPMTTAVLVWHDEDAA
jgi:hypothetical protein